MAIKVDIIFLSYAKNDYLEGLTKQAIKTLLGSEDQEKIKFDVLVIESNKALSPYQYEGSKTIYPDADFGFHKYLNIGINQTHNDYLCLCNNDLIFHEGWATEIIKAMDTDPSLLSAVPYCENFHKQNGFAKNSLPLEGYFGVLTGWCIFVKREIFKIIGPLDENLVFWYCDYDYCNTLEKYSVKNCLISSSFVTHLGSESLNVVNEKQHYELTQLPRIYFNYKWNHRSWLKYQLQLLLTRLRFSN